MIDVPYGTVTHRLFEAGPDGPDSGPHPDAKLLHGIEVVLTPSIKQAIYEVGGERVTIRPQTIHGYYNSQGRLVAHVGDGRPLNVPATRGTSVTPTWHYRVTWRGAQSELQLDKTQRLIVDEGETVDLATVIAWPVRAGNFYRDLLDRIDDARNLGNTIPGLVSGGVAEITGARDEAVDTIRDERADAVGEMTGLRDQTSTFRDQAAAIRDDVQEISGLTGEDEAVAFLLGDPASTTRAATLRSVQRDIPQPEQPTTAHSTQWYHLDEQGRIYRQGDTRLWRSSDDGSTWESIGEFTGGVLGVRELANGELLVGVQGGGLWKTSGYPSGEHTWWQVLTTPIMSHYWSLKWGFSNHENIVVAAPYDGATPPNRGATQPVYLSTDSGETWTQIYEHGQNSEGQHHIHGVHYDPYRDAIWLSTGDGTGRGLHVSWDMGQTWDKIANLQPTMIYAFPECVVFGTDEAPNGIWRIDKPSPANLRLHPAYLIDGGTLFPPTYNLTHIAQGWFKRPGGPLVVPFTTAQSGQRPVVLASHDGYSWWELWRSPTLSTSGGQGFTQAIGPTEDGTYYLTSSSAMVSIRDEPGLVTHTARVARQGAASSTVIHSGKFRAAPGQAVPHASTFRPALQANNTHGDPFGAFELTETGDGIRVTRGCYAIVSANFTHPSGPTSVVAPSVYIYRNGGVELEARSTTATVPILLAPGDVISIRFIHRSGEALELAESLSAHALTILAFENYANG